MHTDSTPRGSAITRGPLGPHLTSRRVPAPGPGEARVRVLLAGICRTDLHAADGLLGVIEGRVLGHELVGEIESAAEGCPFRPGTRVTATPLLPCGVCEGCEAGRPCLRPHMLGVDRDGAFAERVLLPWRALHEVPAPLSARRAAYTEPMAASLAVLKAPIDPSQRGLLLGKNRIAELTRRVLEARGFRRLTQLAQGEEVPRDAFDFAIETAATAETLDALLRAVRPGGCVVLKSRPPAPVPLDVALAVRRDLRLCAVGYGSFAEALRLLGELPVDDLLGEVFPLERFAEAFAKARGSESAKLFLAPA